MAARKKATESKQASPTAYVVLQRIEVEGVGVAWLPVLGGVIDAASKSAAIRQYTGSGEDVKPGSWKAVPLSSWKGGETTRTKVTAERLPFEECV